MKNLKLFTFLLISILSLSGCSLGSNRSVAVTAKKASFSIQNYSLKYETNTYGTLKTEAYEGEGIITIDDSTLNKNNYMVLLQITKTNGGDTDNIEPYCLYIPVLKGIGKFKTMDSFYDGKRTLTKPNYKFEILGYVLLSPNK